ncbi:MAG: ATP-dependent DNA helicase RecG [Candidatus Omnitrophica bacterium]|nr:ATP-dependent DNA helicase RecG [Candidatus Omnitrophota bacterium]
MAVITNPPCRLKDSAQFVKGVGPERLKILTRLGVNTIEDLLYLFPRRYEDRSRLKPISELKPGELQTVRGTVITARIRRARRGFSILQLTVGDDTGTLTAVWFNQPYLAKQFTAGKDIILSGKVEWFDNLQMNSPEYELLNEDEEDTIHTGRIVPIYPLTEGISQRRLRAIIKNVVDNYAGFAQDFLPNEIITARKFPAVARALSSVHFPENFIELARARNRLIFDEFFILQLGLTLKRKQVKEGLTGLPHQIKGGLPGKFISGLHFNLTPGQWQVIYQLQKDMAGSRPMNRLLQGEVGSGKTVIAAYALVLTVQNGFQGVVMAPTEILAVQHYMTFNKWLSPLGINVRLLVSGIPAREKKVIIEEAANGKANVVVGTQALIQPKIKFNNPGLVVIDEQHRFGVVERALLGRKGESPHVLVMTATPIPRTLALTLYGDMDISLLKGLPPGRKPVKTYLVNEAMRNRIYEFLRKEMSRGHQIFIVYPLIEESDKIELKAAIVMYEHLQKVFPEFKLGLLHGRMKPKEQEEVMRLFQENSINALVSTTVIEVGVDIPKATVMLVEHAERFGLSQLHQLRGRIGRGEYDSYCILMSDSNAEEARRRLQIMVKTRDGFRLAEEDLKLRGPGEFFGVRQHGMPELKIGDLLSDREILEEARKDARELVAKNEGIPLLLKDKLRERFKGTAHLASVL